jgi:hypothetical protein
LLLLRLVFQNHLTLLLHQFLVELVMKMWYCSSLLARMNLPVLLLLAWVLQQRQQVPVLGCQQLVHQLVRMILPVLMLGSLQL